MNIIDQLPKFADCPYLLPNPSTLKPCLDVKKAWQQARKLGRPRLDVNWSKGV